MVGRRLGRVAGRLARSAGNTEFVRSAREEYRKGRDGEPSDEEAQVTAALRGVDWAKVKAATTAKTGAAAQRMREMAKDVDWGKVQAGAAVVSSALIAGIASGQIPVTGKVTGPLARAIINDGNLAARVNATLSKTGAAPPDFRQVIDTTATDA